MTRTKQIAISSLKKSFRTIVSPVAIDIYLMAGNLENDSVCHYSQKNNIGTYSHIVNVLNYYIKNDFIIVEKNGRVNKYIFTQKGKKLFDLYSKLKQFMVNEKMWKQGD